MILKIIKEIDRIIFFNLLKLVYEKFIILIKIIRIQII